MKNTILYDIFVDILGFQGYKTKTCFLKLTVIFVSVLEARSSQL